MIKESILDADGGIHSLPERDFELLRRKHGLPRPTRQQIVQRADGRFLLDVGWEDLGAAVEINGIPHLAVLQWDQDLMRANEIVIRGPRLIIFSSSRKGGWGLFVMTSDGSNPLPLPIDHGEYTTPDWGK